MISKCPGQMGWFFNAKCYVNPRVLEDSYPQTTVHMPVFKHSPLFIGVFGAGGIPNHMQRSDSFNILVPLYSSILYILIYSCKSIL